MKLHHVGIAVESLTSALPVFEKLLGAKAAVEEEVGGQKVRIAVFRVGESRLELLEATEEDSPISRFLRKRGQGIHHLTFSVPDLETTLADLERHGFRLIDREPRRGGGGERVAFLHPSSTTGVLIELIEEK